MTDIALSRAHKVYAVKETVKGTLVFPSPALQAKGTITIAGGIPIADEVFTIGSQAFIFKALRAATGQVTIGADGPETVTNIVAAITLDIPTLVTAVDGAADTVIVTAVDPGKAGNAIVFTETAVTNLTVDGTGTLGGTQAGTDGAMIVPAGEWDINQVPDFEDSPEIVDSLDILERFQNNPPPGEWTGSTIARPYGTAGEAPMGDVLIESLMGLKATNAGVSVVYTQAKIKPSFTLWIKKDHTVFFLTGCVCESCKPTVANKGPVMLEWSGRGMKMGWAGTDALSAGEAAGQSELSIDNAKKFTVDGRIYNSTKSDDNGGVGYRITAVNYTTNTITVDPVLPAGGWSNDDVISPFLPVGIILGDPIECRHTTTTVNGVATTIKGMDLTIGSPVQFQEDEITTSGYVEDYVETVRDISGTYNLNFRKDNLPYFYDSIQGLDIPLVVNFGSGAGSLMSISMLRVSLAVPRIQANAPVVALSMGLKALGTAGEDSLTWTFS